ncbi:ATP-binding cassette domain-containing protein [Gallicola sp. Sow4_E12]|uniref:ATP-binding cassette domain-containing protein n=1 Tax=Gallicola sp. Sow4_E12 TaxID=3438785 RepID=UPI003F91F7E0
MEILLENINLELDKKSILTDINARFTSGKTYVLRGKNGSGKTMLLRILAGLVIPTQGTVRIDEKILHKDISFPESVGVLIENPGLLGEFSGLDNLKMIASIRNVIHEADCKKIMNDLLLDPEDNKKVKKYSLGMRQKLGIAMALMEDPEIILLDEPLNGLDERSEKIVIEMLLEEKEKGKLIIIASHEKEELEYLSDEIIEIKAGEIVQKKESIKIKSE